MENCKIVFPNLSGNQSDNYTHKGYHSMQKSELYPTMYFNVGIVSFLFEKNAKNDFESEKMRVFRYSY